MNLHVRRRRSDRQFGSPWAYLRRYAHELVTFTTAGIIMWGGFSYFATAADVETKFELLDRKIDTTAAEERKYRIENELFRLRSTNSRDPSIKAQIQRYEADLQTIDNRLRDLTNERNQKRNR